MLMNFLKFFISCFLFFGAFCDSQVATSANKHVGYSILLDQKLNMRDGVKLSANVWIPGDAAGPLPVVFTITPYIASEMHSWGVYFADAGYVFVSVDTRGRGSSEGIFNPFEDGVSDGYDVVEWLSNQSWSNGKVAMRGGSYEGALQWSVMAANHPNLMTTIPIASVYPGHDFPKEDDIFVAYSARWLALTNGKVANSNFVSDSDYWRSVKKKIYRDNLAFEELGVLTTTNKRVFDKWMSHPTEDNYWKSLTPSSKQYSKIDIPILTVTGYFDNDQKGALRYYDEHLANASKKGKDNHFLLIGPWDHRGTSRPQSEYRGLKFGPASKFSMSKLQVEWLDWVLKDGDKPAMLKNRVNYYVMGTDEWKHVDSFESLAGNTKTYYLSSLNTPANDVFSSGVLSEEKGGASDIDSYVYDPLANAELRVAEPAFEYESMWSQINAFKENSLIYHSGPLKEDIIISGRFSFSASISMNVPDTDIQVELSAVMPDGSAHHLGLDKMRARYRNGSTKSELVPINKVQKYVFDSPKVMSRRLKKGTRIRLVLSAFDNYHYQKNYNSEKPNSTQSQKDSNIAKVELHVGDGTTFLTLPIQ